MHCGGSDSSATYTSVRLPKNVLLHAGWGYNNVTICRTDGVRHVGKKPSHQRLNLQSFHQECVSNFSVSSQDFRKVITEVHT